MRKEQDGVSLMGLIVVLFLAVIVALFAMKIIPSFLEFRTAKTAIVGYVSGLALQLAEKGIRANVVSPGNTYFDGGVWQSIETGNPDLYDMAVGLNPTGHMGSPEEIAGPVVFLASPVSRRISGTNLVVDGALTRGIQL